MEHVVADYKKREEEVKQKEQVRRGAAREPRRFRAPVAPSAPPRPLTAARPGPSVRGAQEAKTAVLIAEQAKARQQQMLAEIAAAKEDLRARQAALEATAGALGEAQLATQKQRKELAEVRDLDAKNKAELASVVAQLAQDKASHVVARKTLAAAGFVVEAIAIDKGEGAAAGHAHGEGGKEEEADAPPSQELA